MSIQNPKPWRPRSLQTRLLLPLLGLVLLVWLATAWLTWRDARHELDELLDSHLAQAAAVLVVQQSRALDGEEEEAPAAPSLHRYAAKVAFQVFHEGQLTLRSANAPLAPMLPLPGAQGFASISLNGQPWRVFATHGSERDVQVLVGEQLDSRDDILHAVLRSTLWPMALALPLLALAASWAVHRGLAPLRRLGQALAQRQPQALQPLPLDDAPSEMAPMLAALNQLFGRIDGLLASERRFTADAAHELRTPIAAIRAQAQVALAEADDQARQHALRATLAGCDRATRVVAQLLSLSRLEAESAPAQPGHGAGPAPDTDLASTARSVLADLAPQALARGQTLSLQAEGPCPLPVDPTLLSLLLRNLLDNALRYSPAGAEVQVRIAADGAPTLQIDDSGPGLADADIARLGERFHRVLRHDVLDTQPSGSGLGWSIVRRIAATQGAQIDVGCSALLGGLRVRLVWPTRRGRPT